MTYRLLFIFPTLILVINTPALAQHDAPVGNPPQTQKAIQAPTPQEIDAALTVRGREFLEKSPQLILFSLSPADSVENNGIAATKPVFHDYEILGKVILSDSKAKADLLASFYEGLSSARVTARCFSPRHGLRAVCEGNTVDLLICFECRQFNVYVNGKQVVSHKAISPSPQLAFDKILTAAKIPSSP